MAEDSHEITISPGDIGIDANPAAALQSGLLFQHRFSDVIYGGVVKMLSDAIHLGKIHKTPYFISQKGSSHE
jgi:hypothetical protein